MATKKTKKVIALDGDKLGMIGGTLGALIVLCISWFVHSGNISTTLIRMGWSFVICYGATFFLVRMILRTTLMEMIEQEAIEKKNRKQARSSDKKKEDISALPATEE